MSVEKSDAIIIRVQPLGDSSLILTFYTENFGKIKAVAKGAKQLKNKLRSTADLLNFGNLIFYDKPTRDLQNVSDFDLIHDFHEIKSDLSQMAYACYFAELIDAIEVDRSENPPLYDFFIYALRSVPKASDLSLFARTFELHLLRFAGYTPDLNGSEISTNFRVSRGTIALMKKIQRSDFSDLNRIIATPQNRAEMKKITKNLIRDHTQRRIKSLAFIEEIEN